MDFQLIDAPKPFPAGEEVEQIGVIQQELVDVLAEVINEVRK